MELQTLKEKIINEINEAEKKDVLEEVLLLLNKSKNGELLDILKNKDTIFKEDDNLFKRLS